MNITSQQAQIQLIENMPLAVQNSDYRRFYELSADPSPEWRELLQEVWNSNEIESNGDQNITVEVHHHHSYIVWECSTGVSQTGDPTDTIQRAVNYTNTKANTNRNIQ